MNKILVRGGYFPIIVFTEKKRAYFNALEKARTGRAPGAGRGVWPVQTPLASLASERAGKSGLTQSSKIN